MPRSLSLEGTDTIIRILYSGDIYQIIQRDVMVNQLKGYPLDGSLNQIYLRLFTDKGIEFQPLVGSNSLSDFGYGKNGALWQGVFHEVYYQVRLQISKKDIWFWSIDLQGKGSADLIYGQDIGNATVANIEVNEAYISQYIDHHITKDEVGYTISSRQNQSQNGKFPIIQQGALSPTIGYSTDGYQFFGRSYKETNQPEALYKETLPNEVYQYEFAYTALQSERFEIENRSHFVFYGTLITDNYAVVSQPLISRTEIENEYQQLGVPQISAKPLRKKKIGAPITGRALSFFEIDTLFPHRVEVESCEETSLSFFTQENHHVVTKEKEVQMERNHGYILLSGAGTSGKYLVMATTVYMFGIFNSQLTLGNTSMNKLMSNNRNSLNVVKHSGQRVYIEKEGEWHLLTMPSIFEMGLNSASWYYALEDDLLKITTYSVTTEPAMITEICSKKRRMYSFAITNHLLMSDGEDELSYQFYREGNTLFIKGTETSPITKVYPELVYSMTLNSDFSVTDETVFGTEAAEVPLLTLLVKGDKVTLTIRAQQAKKSQPISISSYEDETKKYAHCVDSLLNGFKLSHPTIDVEKVNLISRWFTQNMLVHFLSPHGLEQYGGAAWGTRDVLQGPTEFFLSMSKANLVRDILLKVYANQFLNNGQWPQWFMFDRYETIKAEESHGDIIVWPLKVVADYLDKTNDYSILAELVPYSLRETNRKTIEKRPLYEHLKKEISYIKENLLPGTYLSNYGDGDWDDTLQPIDDSLKKNMASSWTVALTYASLKKLSRVLKAFDHDYATKLADFSEKIEKDFRKYFLSTDVIPGFIFKEVGKEAEFVLHPEDTKTGINYRLLPMIESIVAELFTPEEVLHHYALIQNHLSFPDGVRLMSSPANYQGGVCKQFKRAEQAANFGREIGLQYVHAHIRYAEALAKIGKRQEVWHALNVVNPINIQKVVKNAELRQSNVYFSSSDGDFKTRYEAAEKFDLLTSSQIGVKGGWRVYSSGPGIFMGVLISQVLGIRESWDQVVFDPMLPDDLDGLTVDFSLYDIPVRIRYHLNQFEQKILINGQETPYNEESNPYRKGGMVILEAVIKQKLFSGCLIDVYN